MHFLYICEKTPYTILTSKRTPKLNHVIKIEGHKHKLKVQNTKFQGFYPDKKASWKRHIHYISGKAKFLTCESLKNLYYSFVYSVLI